MRRIPGVWVGVMAAALGLGADRPGPKVAISDEAAAKQPRAAVAADGTVFAVFGQGEEVKVAVSADQGREFAPAVTVGRVPALMLGRRRGPRIATTDGSVVVAAIGQKQPDGHGGDLLSWHSADAGRTWTGPTRVNGQDGSAREGLHGMDAGPGGAVFVAWLDDRAGRKEVWGARSTDGGASWKPDALIYRSPERSVCECCHPSVAFAPDGRLFVMWRNSLKGARDMYVAVSEDGGATFSDAEKVGEGTWLLNACPMDGGAISVGPEGQVETAWRRDNLVYAAPFGWPGPERRLGTGEQPTATFGPGGLYVAWLGRAAGSSVYDALLIQTPDRPKPYVLAEHAAFPTLAAAPVGAGPVVVVWESTDGSGRLLSCVIAPRR